MALVQNTFDGGTVGTTVSEANSGGASGTPFTLVQIVAGATCTYQTAAAKHGGKGCRITGNGSGAFMQHDMVADPKLSTRFYVNFPSAPSAACQIYTPRSVVNYIGGININTALKLQVTNIAGTPVFTTTAALTAGTYYRIEISHQVATSTTGAIQFKYFVGDSTTAVESFTTTTADLGTSNIIQYRIGKINSAGNSPLDLDSITFNAGSTTLLGPHVDLNVPPVADAGTGLVNIEPGTVVTLNGSGSADPDGTISTYSWTQTTGPSVGTLSGSGSSRTFTAPYTLAGTVLGFTLTVTDAMGASNSATVSHAVLPATERAAVNGTWAPMRMASL